MQALNKDLIIGLLGGALVTVLMFVGVDKFGNKPKDDSSAAYLKITLDAIRQEREHYESLTKKTEQKQTTTQRNRHVVTERYDPSTGAVVSRRTSTSNSNRQAISQTEVIQAVNVDRVTTQTVHQDTIATPVIAVEPRRRQQGLGIGMLGTPSGVGPAASLRLAEIGPINLDATAGIANGPRAGLGVSTEVLPNLNIGVHALISPQGESLQLTHPAIPFVGLSPGITIQYRF
jgi:hypothetical protein